VLRQQQSQEEEEERIRKAREDEEKEIAVKQDTLKISMHCTIF
jgi:hypothetical protein